MVEILKDIPSVEITSFQSSVANLRLHTPMKLPFGTFDSRPSGVVQIQIKTQTGVIYGYGEGATLPRPLFTDDSGETIAHAGQFILENISSSKLSQLDDVFSRIQTVEFPNGDRFPTARMMVEMAIIDAYSKAAGRSVKEIFGVPGDMVGVPYGKSLGEGTKEEIIKQADEALRSGATKIKLKISPTSHSEVISAVDILRSRGGFEIMVDANGTFDSRNLAHLDILKTVDGLGLVVIEEPVSRVGEVRGIKAVSELRQSIDFKTPICLDDCLVDFGTTLSAIENGLANVVNIKPGRIGSILKSIELNSICREKEVQIMVGGMLEATPGRCMTVVLASFFKSLGSKIPGDLSLAQERLSQDLVNKDQQLQYNSKGEVVIPDSLGWGFGEMTFFKQK